MSNLFPGHDIKFMRWWIPWSLSKLLFSVSKVETALHKIRLSSEVTNVHSLAACKRHIHYSIRVITRALKLPPEKSMLKIRTALLEILASAEATDVTSPADGKKYTYFSERTSKKALGYGKWLTGHRPPKLT